MVHGQRTPGRHAPRQQRRQGVSSAISPDGTLAATGGSNGTAYLWQTATGQMIGTAADPGGSAVNTVAFSPDGKTLATADKNGNAYLWAISAAGHTTTLAATLADPGGAGVWSLAFSPDGKTLATGDFTGSTYLVERDRINESHADLRRPRRAVRHRDRVQPRRQDPRDRQRQRHHLRVERRQRNPHRHPLAGRPSGRRHQPERHTGHRRRQRPHLPVESQHREGERAVDRPGNRQPRCRRAGVLPRRADSGHRRHQRQHLPVENGLSARQGSVTVVACCH